MVRIHPHATIILKTHTAIIFFENILAHLVEHLSGKQSGVGSNPTDISFVSCLKNLTFKKFFGIIYIESEKLRFSVCTLKKYMRYLLTQC